jgi:hypothetical protein
MLSRSVRGGLFVAGLSAACSGSPGSNGGNAPSDSEPNGSDKPSSAANDDPSANPAGTKKDVCATLDYGHSRANRDYFRMFADDAAAFDYSKDFLAYSEMPEGTEVSHDGRMVRLLGRVYEGFRAVFPRETEGLDAPPRIVVINADGVNAFAGYDERPDMNKAPWVFWVHRGTLTSSTPDDQVEGLFAHELAHLLLRNLLPETRAKIRTHYRLPGGEEQGIIGAVTPDDPAVRQQAEELRSMGAKVGRYAAFGALPVSTYQDSDYEDLLATLGTMRGQSPDASACNTADKNIQRARTILSGKVSVHNAALYLSKQERDELGTLVPSTSDALKKCYAHVKMPLYELWVRDRVRRTPDLSTDVQKALVTKALDPSTTDYATMRASLSTEVERRIDDNADRPTIDRFIEVVDTLHRRAGTLESDPSLPIEQLRVFDLEEDADDAAVRVLRYLDEDPLSNARLYVNMMPNASECTRAIDTGSVPAYGRFIDEHNATCWRLFHSKELVRALEQCPKVPPTRKGASQGASPARTAPADRSAARLRRRTR